MTDRTGHGPGGTPRPRRRYAYGVPSEYDDEYGQYDGPGAAGSAAHGNGHASPETPPGPPAPPGSPGPGPGYPRQQPAAPANGHGPAAPPPNGPGPAAPPNGQGPGYGASGHGRPGFGPPGSGGAQQPWPQGEPPAPGVYNPYQGRYTYTEPYDYTSGSATGGPPAHGGHPAPPPPGPAQEPPAPDAGETLALRGPRSVPPRQPGAPAGADGHGPAYEGPGESRDEGQAAPTRRAGQGRADRRRAAKRIKRRRRLSATKEIPILIGVAILIALVLKTFLVQAFVIPSGSMEQTIRVGDRVLVDKLTPWFGSRPERGDVIVFEDPGGWLDEEHKPKKDPPFGIKQGKEFLTFIGLLPSDDQQDLIKRVVGVGGDTVACCNDQGRITVNGHPLNEPYVHPGNEPSRIKFKVKVPQGRVFVLGDHRANSGDSRYHMREPHQGTISEDLVVGRAVVIAWPFDHWRRLEEPKTFASVPDAAGAAAAPARRENPVAQLPFSAELPLVMGVVGLYRLSDRRQGSVRSECGGLGGRRTVRLRRPGGRASRTGRQGGRRGAAGRGQRE
ncbi:signal peptidase I [Streptomyces cacaoi]|uniref:signal peptidase I n=1 Tax=Streptomyces cacaoi TaxID=1898 RepID=UPI0036FDE44B